MEGREDEVASSEAGWFYPEPQREGVKGMLLIPFFSVPYVPWGFSVVFFSLSQGFFPFHPVRPLELF